MLHFLQRLNFLAIPFTLPSLKSCVALPAIELSAFGSPGGSEGQGIGVRDMITPQIVNGESNDTIRMLHWSLHDFGALQRLYITVSLSPSSAPSRSNCYNQSLWILSSELRMSLYAA